ncbi:MAG TPA: YbaK/EbsC family protein [Coriobacteriia bacterium]|nr:YbaK/EbsC family protein [Coriobacteriia bacterium]
MTDDSDRTTPKRSGSAQRVRDYLSGHGLAHEIVTFDHSTKTAQMAADAMGCELGQIVKSLVFVAGSTPLVALVPGDRRGDPVAIAAVAGRAEARIADADTVRSATGFAIGGVSPFDLPPGLLVLADESLARFEVVYPAAGTPASMVRIGRARLLELTGARVARISQ